MIASASTQDYLLLREIAPLVRVSAKVLRQQVKRGDIPAEFIMRSGEVRPVIRIHRAWLAHAESVRPALMATALIPWSVR